MAHNDSKYFRSNLKRVRGMGAAHTGTEHFWLQRLSALALVPLSIWFVVKLATVLVIADREAAVAWFRDPITAIAMALFVFFITLHAKLGLQVIIEDYVHCERSKLALLIVNGTFTTLCCVASLIAIAHLHFVGI